jgi:hypothetical protein
MREIRPSGSVRGVRRKPYPYRDPVLPVQSTAALPTLPRTPPEATEPRPANARHGSTLTPATAPDAPQAAPKSGLQTDLV